MKISYTKKAKKDYKLALKRNVDRNKIVYVLKQLEDNKQLELSLKDHTLIGKYQDCRECHIENDYLMIYKIFDKDHIVIQRFGTHSDLFD